MHDAHLNCGTPIFKIHILAQFVSHHFRNNQISRAKRLYFKSQTHIENYNPEINTPSAWDSLLYAKCLKLPHHPMQILVNFKIEGMCIGQSLRDTILRILLSRFLVSFTNRQAYLRMKMKYTLCLKVFGISIKTHKAGWNFWLVHMFIHLVHWKHQNFHLCCVFVKILMFQHTRWNIFGIHLKK